MLTKIPEDDYHWPSRKAHFIYVLDHRAYTAFLGKIFEDVPLRRDHSAFSAKL